MWKSVLQLLVCLMFLARLVSMAAHVRRVWVGGDGLALQFQRELRRRGLIAPHFRLPAS